MFVWLRYSICLLFLFSSMVRADGLLLSSNEDYPADLLRNRLTKVDVEINGIMAKISVYQEFVNEWHQPTDAVYSFPLPAHARATKILYWYEDKVFQAILKVREQAVNPGTGEGGTAALVNQYIGRNGIKIALNDIKPGMIQKIQLEYVQLCDYFQGTCSYEYPLNSSDFITYPLDHLEFNFMIHSNESITSAEVITHSGYEVLSLDSLNLVMRLVRPKAYLDRNLIFRYHSEQNTLGVDFYSVNNDTMNGHFALFIRPPNIADADSILPRRIIFLLSTSSRMFGYALSESIEAIKAALSQLNENDLFNIVLYDDSVHPWQSKPVVGTELNIQNAVKFIQDITVSSGANMEQAITTCLNQIVDNEYSNVLLIFTDGFSYIDPIQIESQNIYKTGIFPIAIGNDFNFARLEMLADYNYGFVTYINQNDNIKQKMHQVVTKATQPILKDVQIEYGRADLSEILPQRIPSTYAGSYFFITGRYVNSGISALSIGGKSLRGNTVHDFLLDFSSGLVDHKFIEPFWAKMKIDWLEWQIEIYGETPERKSRLINLSLTYNIRCRYTAYVADYETEYTTGLKELLPEVVSVPRSHLISNYPNPFNPTTVIKFYISPKSAEYGPRLLKIYNVLGQLICIIDLSQYEAGYHEIVFKGLNSEGLRLSSGIYFVVLQIGRELSTMRITMVN